MLSKYYFIPAFFSLWIALFWWSGKIHPETQGSQTESLTQRASPSQTTARQDLIESMNQIVSFEKYYHSVYGHYTQLLKKIGYTVPNSLSEIYDIRVAEGAADRLLVSAFSEVHGKIVDIASMDQDFQLHTNFELPPPRIESLKSYAQKQMRLIKNLSPGQRLEEQGVFKGFFTYSVQLSSKNEQSVIAKGTKNPVKGVTLELESSLESESLPPNENQSILSGNWDNGVLDHQAFLRTGQVNEDSLIHLQEETFLAQKIFYGEMGRYAKDWLELSKVVHFDFEGKDLAGTETFPQQKESPLNRTLTSVSNRNKKPLEIEAITDGEK